MREVNGYFVPDDILELVKSNNKLEAVIKLREFHCISWQLADNIISVAAQEIEIRCPRNQNEQPAKPK